MPSKRRPTRQKPQSAATAVRTVSPPPLLTRIVLPALIVAAGAWAYATSFDGVFVLDDVRAIARNQTIRTLWPPSTPLSPPTASTVAGRPIANLSLAITYALAPPDAREVFEIGGPGAPPDAADRLRRNASAYHAGNLLIHLSAALVLFGIVRRTLLSDRLRPAFETSAPWVAGVIALVWVVHPLTTAAVTYIVQRAESLMGLFYLLALYGVIRAAGGARVRSWAAVAIASCALGMATKETMVSAPLVAGVWLWIFAREDRRRRCWPMLAGLASTWLILAALVYGERRAPSLGLDGATAWPYLLAQTEVVIHYLRQAFVPTSLVFFYDWPLAGSIAAVLPQAATLAALAAASLIGVIRRWPVGFAGAWFFLILAPSSSVLPIVTEVAAEHRMYLPLAAVIAVVAAGVHFAGPRVGLDRRAGTAATLAATAALVVLLGVETRARNRDYASEEGLWRDTVAKRPADPRPRIAYGSALSRTGRLAEAEVQLHAAVELSPDDPVARVRLGSVLAQQGKIDAAIQHLERAAARQPDDPAAHRLLGEIYAGRGQDALAARHLERALPAMGGDPELLVRLAFILADSRDWSVRNGARAMVLADRAVAVTERRNPWALAALALAQRDVGRMTEAGATARAAVELARSQGADPDVVQQLERLAEATTVR